MELGRTKEAENSELLLFFLQIIYHLFSLQGSQCNIDDSQYYDYISSLIQLCIYFNTFNAFLISWF